MQISQTINPIAKYRLPKRNRRLINYDLLRRNRLQRVLRNKCTYAKLLIYRDRIKMILKAKPVLICGYWSSTWESRCHTICIIWKRALIYILSEDLLLWRYRKLIKCSPNILIMIDYGNPQPLSRLSRRLEAIVIYNFWMYHK